MAQYAQQPAYSYASTLPITYASKPTYNNTSQYYTTPRIYSSSPPEAPESVTSSSNLYSAISTSSYADSAVSADYETASSNLGNGVDLHEYMQEKFEEVFDPLPLDRSLATQAQTSGKLNAKHREILELQAKAQARLAKSRTRFAEGMQDAKEVKRDLEWTQKRVSTLKTKASRKHPKEYQRSRDRYPSPEY
jgi:exonuclease VII small subunit